MLFFPAWRYIGLLVVLFFTLLLLSEAVEARWSRVARHTAAAAQPSIIGRSIVELERVGNRIYTGYGDYGLNTGPIKVFAYNLRHKRLSYQGLTMETEAILKYRQIGKSVLAISADVRGSAKHQFALRKRGWQIRNNIDASAGSSPAEHIYDVVSWRGELWAAGGMANRHAGLWRSRDNGKNWRLELSMAPNWSKDRDVSRFYFIATYRGELYVQSVDFCQRYSCPKNRSRVYDGSRWRVGPDLLMGRGTGYAGDQFAGHLILRNYENAYFPHSLHAYNGKRVFRPVPDYQNIHDYSIGEDGYLYALTTNAPYSDGRYAQKVLRTKNLKDWQCLFLAPRAGTARSIEIVNYGKDNRHTTVYLGTTKSELIKRTATGVKPCKV